jgi:hypothetical protein
MKRVLAFLLVVSSMLFINSEASAKIKLFRSKFTQAQESVDGDNSTAQGVALIQAAKNRVHHCGGYHGYEGVGSGSTPDQAIGNCCFWGKLSPREIGVAQGSNGKFFACVRY